MWMVGGKRIVKVTRLASVKINRFPGQKNRVRGSKKQGAAPQEGLAGSKKQG